MCSSDLASTATRTALCWGTSRFGMALGAQGHLHPVTAHLFLPSLSGAAALLYVGLHASPAAHPAHVSRPRCSLAQSSPRPPVQVSQAVFQEAVCGCCRGSAKAQRLTPTRCVSGAFWERMKRGSGPWGLSDRGEERHLLLPFVPLPSAASGWGLLEGVRRPVPCRLNNSTVSLRFSFRSWMRLQ